MDFKQLSALPLAYIGDSCYEIEVRLHFLESGITKVNDLHKITIKYTCAEHQSHVMKDMILNNFLTEDEIQIFKRGRNASANKTRKTLSHEDYNNATGFETLVGYLYLSNNTKRIKEIAKYSLEYKEV